MATDGRERAYEPTDQQLGVVKSRENQILVEAGAGSGKTSTTVERYIALLDGDPPLEPREILAFTFTDKAAGELREKVRSALKDRERREAREGAEAVSMSDAWVGTFHAICNRILKAWPIEAGVDPGFNILDDTNGETLRKESFDRALRRLCATDEAVYETVGRFREAPLRRCIQYAYEELRSRGIEHPRLPEFEDTPFPSETAASLREMAREALAGDLSKTRTESLEALCDKLDREAWGELRLDRTLALRAGNNVDLSRIEESYRVLCDGIALQQADPIRRQMAALLELYGEEYAKSKLARSSLDYEDLQLLALRLLKDNQPILDFYQQRFSEVMVDEFQDTNLLQLSLVQALAGEATLMTVGDEMQSIYGFRHADVQLFRERRDQDGIDRHLLSANFRSLPLIIGAVNEIGDRLDQGAPGSADSVARHEFKELSVCEDADFDAPATVSLLLTGRTGWKSLDLGDLAPEGDPGVGQEQDHYYEAEALAVARHLRLLVDQRGVAPGEIAILLRAKTRTHLYVEALKQFGLTPYVAAGKGFWDTREAMDLRCLLAVIANPLDDNSLLGALTSPACGLSSDALWLLKRATPRYKPLWPTLSAVARNGQQPASDPPDAENALDWIELIPDEDLAKARSFVETVGRLRELATTSPLDELIDVTVTETGYDLANLVRDPSGNGMATIRRAASLARDFEASEGRRLRGFLDWVDLSAELDKEGAAATADEASDVVRIMTIHASKGLEFPVVCVPDLGREIQNRHDHALRLGRSDDRNSPGEFKLGLNLPHYGSGKLPLYDSNELKEAGRISNQDEELRLLHVAMTRAESHLILSGVLPEKWPQKGISTSSPMITRISKAFELDPEDPDGWHRSIEVEAGTVDVVRNLASEERAAELRERHEPVAAPTGSGAGEIRPPIVPADFRIYPDVPLSFSAFAEFTECRTRFYARRILRLSEPGSPGRPGNPDEDSLSGRNRATKFGTAVHNVLERLARDGWSSPGTGQLAGMLGEQGLKDSPEDGSDESEVAVGRRMIEDFLASELGQRVRSSVSRPEVPLLLSIEGATIRGSADLIVEGDVPLILDYKTNRLGEDGTEGKMGAYELQRSLYAMALIRARDLESVSTAYVFLNRADEPVMKSFDAGDFSGTQASLRAMLDEITAGRFFDGGPSGPGPCRDCWACTALHAQIERAETPTG